MSALKCYSREEAQVSRITPGTDSSHRDKEGNQDAKGLPGIQGQQRMRHFVFPHCKEMPGKSAHGDREEPSAFLTLPGDFRTLFHPKDRVGVHSHETQEESGCSLRSAQGTSMAWAGAWS